MKSLPAGCNLINCNPNGYGSWYKFSKVIFEILKNKGFRLKTKNIIPITSDMLSQIALRPENSRLDNSKLHSILNYKIPQWRNILDDELKNQLKKEIEIE